MQAKTYEYDSVKTYLNDQTAQTLTRRRQERVKGSLRREIKNTLHQEGNLSNVEDPILSQTYWMSSSSLSGTPDKYALSPVLKKSSGL